MMPQEQFVRFDGTRLWTCHAGQGVPLILGNGGPGCCDYLEPVAQLLDGAARVIRFEARGCGRSDPAPEYTLQGCLDELEAIRRHYKIGRWIVAGHSAGADLALLYALHYPQRTLGLICIAGGRVHNDREWHKAYQHGRDAGLEKPLDYAYPPNLEVNRQLNAAWKRYIQRPTLLRELAGLDRPALFLYGDRDIRPSWPVEQVANLLPNARFVMIRGADHHLWLSHATEMAVILHNFVTELDTPHTTASFDQSSTSW